jgi:hypothetical protein
MTTKRYNVDFYDSFDGWLNWPKFETDDLEEAIAYATKMTSSLDKNNRKMGEHYGVIDSHTNREIYCTKEGGF